MPLNIAGTQSLMKRMKILHWQWQRLGDNNIVGLFFLHGRLHVFSLADCKPMLSAYHNRLRAIMFMDMLADHSPVMTTKLFDKLSTLTSFREF